MITDLYFVVAEISYYISEGEFITRLAYNNNTYAAACNVFSHKPHKIYINDYCTLLCAKNQ